MISLLRDLFNFILIFSFFNDAFLVEKLQVPWILKALLVLAPVVNLPYLLSFRWTSSHKLFSLYVIVCFVSSFININIPDDPYIAFNLAIANFCIVAIFSQYPIRKTVSFIWISVMVSVSYAMLRPDTISEWSFRKTGGVQDANEFATHCLIFFPLGVYLSRISGLRWLPIISFIAFLEGILLAGSVSSVLSAAALLLLVALRKRRVVSHYLFRARRILIVLPVFLVVSVLGWTFVQGEELSELPIVRQIIQVSNRVGANEGNAASRMSAWRAGFNMFTENPLIGVGPLNFKLVSKEYWETPDYHEGSAEAHNTIVKVFAETGVLGAALFCTLVVNLLLRGFVDLQTPNRQLLFLSYLGMLSMGLTLSLSFDKYFWLVFALVDHEDKGDVPIEIEETNFKLPGRTLALPDPEKLSLEHA